MFVIKKIALVFSMIILSYIGEVSGDSRSFFISWFIFLLLIVIEYIEAFQFKKIQGDAKVSLWFYVIGIITFGGLTAVSLMGSFGLIQLSTDYILIPNTDFVIMKGLFYLTFGNNVTMEGFILFISAIVFIFFALEFLAKPVLSYGEKHKLKYSKKGEVAS